MNESIALSRGWGIANAGEALAFPGRSAAESAAKETPSAAEAMRTLYVALDNLVAAALNARSTAAFQAARAAVYPTYFNAALAIPSLAKIVFPPYFMEKLIRESFCELEADLREHGLAILGQAVSDQAFFTAWTLRKIADLASQFPEPSNLSLDQNQLSTLTALVEEFRTYAIWTRFHLHCLVSAIHAQQAIFPEPLELIMDGLRSAVNSYALLRRTLDILSPPPSANIEPAEWDDEDEALRVEANRDTLICEAV